jgi:hypothetical protein
MNHRLWFAVVGIAVAVPPAVHGQEEKATPGMVGRKVLDRFIGEWNADVTDKPAKFVPDGAKRNVKQSISSILKYRFILGREVSQADGMKVLWLMTHDPKAKTYPFWYFNNKGVLGGEWENSWDEASATLTGNATDTPKGWTSHGTNRFSDRNTSHVAVWMKDETGELLFDSAARKTRQPKGARAKTLSEWSKHVPDDKLPAEMKVLQRLIGTWDAAAVARPAVWTPKEVRTTSKVVRKWALDGRLLQDTSEISDGSEALSLLTYDPARKAYRSWWFNSEGHTSKSTAQWDAASKTLSFKADLPDGLTSHASVRFIDQDRHDWTVRVTDGDGKVYFDGEWKVTRRKK